MHRLILALLPLAVGAAACSGGAADPFDPAPIDQTRETPQILAGTDLSVRSVPLEDVHFDTFGGGYIPLSEIGEDHVIALRDAIPPLDSPKYDAISGGDWLAEDDLVLAYEGLGGGAWAYPLKILNFHEIVNDELDGVPVLITYCPLCRSGIVYDRRLEDGRRLAFGNTGALYESDLIMYDRETSSYWWQTAGEAIVGTLTGERLSTLPAATMTWGQWKELRPDTLVLSRETGFYRDYQRAPFAGYAERINAGRFGFPVSEDSQDDRLPLADEVLGVTIDGESVAYPLRQLGDAAVHDTVGGIGIVVFSGAEGPSASAFVPRAGGRDLSFTFRKGAYVDEETGSRWDLSGRAVEGPLAGERLEPVPSRYTFWFSFVGAFPETRLFSP